MSPYIFALIIFAITAVAVTEILIAYEKREMKKDFLSALDQEAEREGKQNSQGGSSG